MAKKQRPPEDTGTWMNTYSDLVTLLLTFFVLLFSFSSVNEDKWEKFIKAFMNEGEDTSQIVLNVEDPEDGTGLSPMTGNVDPANADSIDTQGTLPENFDDLYRYLKAYAEQNNMESSISISQQDDMVFIRFQNDIFFDPDKSYLRPSAYETLDFVGNCLAAVQEQIWMVNINGHTAAVEFPEYYQVSDWMLSSERASVLAVYFDDEKGFDPKKLRPMGYGKNYPIVPNDTEVNREQNRRVDMMIISNSAAMAKDTAMYDTLEALFDPGKFPQSGGAKEVLAPPDTDVVDDPFVNQTLPEEPATTPDTTAPDTATDTTTPPATIPADTPATTPPATIPADTPATTPPATTPAAPPATIPTA